MKVKEIIALASAICGMEDVEGAILRYEKAKEEEVEFVFEESIEAKIDKAIKCINLTMSRIASEYLSLKKVETLTTDFEGKIPYADFSYRAIEIIDVKDLISGESLEYECLPFHLYLAERNKAVNVVYRYLPEEVASLEDEVYLPEFVTKRIIALGVVSDLMLSANVYDESKFWNEKFEEAIEKSISKRKVGGIPPRKFM